MQDGKYDADDDGDGADSGSSSSSESEAVVPTAVDIMSGERQPVGQALRACGWSVKAFDWAIDPSHDLSDTLSA